MSGQASREALEAMAAEQGPRWRSRKEAWLDGYRHGEQQARMTGAHVEALRAQFREELLDAAGAVAKEHYVAAQRPYHEEGDWEVMTAKEQARWISPIRTNLEAALAALPSTDQEGK